MKLLKYALMVLFSAGMMSCGGGGGDDPVDEKKPTGSITSASTVTAGDNYTVAFSASDDMELESYRVQIAFSNAVGMTVKTYQDFSFDSNSDLTDADGNNLPSIDGKKTASVSFPVSTRFGENTVAKKGMYKLTVTLTDASGKASDPVTKEFQIQ
ncbi:DUF4625 domain-containing protein [Marinifilum sp. D714]|uniref:DUF4625 domain-containing protein n=1 Tax=Marinifilum sp. D714 TaxID=2937523 RepID=UPI0027BC2925|nr:DUF4625 domain-containing protein [Marinifilum sp. D714]MDQ2179579.1 DUF4625 domain-containing protein [Marinifilum sp. D714]